MQNNKFLSTFYACSFLKWITQKSGYEFLQYIILLQHSLAFHESTKRLLKFFGKNEKNSMLSVIQSSAM